MSKKLVAYFSASGVTAKKAKKLAAELGADLYEMFCSFDEFIYSNLPGIEFRRTGTCCHGDEKCDFRFVRNEKR